jgi:GntR family transcriptional repressor for pyruvate dehydrogenase complex
VHVSEVSPAPARRPSRGPSPASPAPSERSSTGAAGKPARARKGSSRDLAVKRIRPAYEQVAEQLRALVLSGTVAPGDRLPVEGDLSAEFGVSRSTIREAIRLLSSQSLVHTVRGPAGGTFVSAADPESLREYLETSIGLLSGNDGISAAHLLEVRDILEVPAARLAAVRRSEDDLVLMRATIERERGQRDRGERFEQNQQFHAQILVAANNPLLAVVTDPVYSVIQTRFLKDEERPFYTRVNDEHTEILGHIERGDGEGAAQAMAAHLAQLRGVYGAAAPAAR